MEKKAASDRFRQVLVQTVMRGRQGEMWPKQGCDRTSAIVVVYFNGGE